MSSIPETTSLVALILWCSGSVFSKTDVCLTVIGQYDDVDAAVQAHLLEAVHKLAHDSIYSLERRNHLQETKAHSNATIRCFNSRS